MMSNGISRGDVSGRLAGKVALVTGTGGGQGRAAALLFALAGATVIGCGRNAQALDGTRALAESSGLTIHQVALDVTDPDQSKAWVDRAARDYGGIDILYNNAGFMRAAPVGEMDDAVWHDTLRGEMDVVFFPTRAVWPHLIARGGGAIVNISSTSGMVGIEGIGCLAHGAAKAGVIGMTRQYAVEGAPHWIRCNTISPGPVNSPGLEANVPPDLLRLVRGSTLLPRLGEGEDVAYAGLFLASDEARWITGINLPVDGGMTAKSGFTDHS